MTKTQGRWRYNNLASELIINGKLVANIAPVGRCYYYEVVLPGKPMRTGWHMNRYEAMRAVRKILRKTNEEVA